MKEYVIDANILFSAMVSGKEIYKSLFTMNKFYVPDFAFSEMEEHKKTIITKTKLKNPQKLKDFTVLLFSNLVVIPNFVITEKSMRSAYELCRNIDEKDTIYVALAIELNKPLLTRDKSLYNGLVNKGFKLVFMFDNIFNNF